MNLKLFAVVILSFIIFNSCKKDSTKETSVYVGNFVISESKLMADLVIPTNEQGDYTLPSTTDITAAIQTALLNAVTCTSAADSYVELREDKSMFLSCSGANPINAGTWDEISATSLLLNMNATAIPPVGFSLTVTDIVADATGLTGKTIVPLPAAMVAALIAPMTLSDQAPAVFIVNISIKFLKK